MVAVKTFTVIFTILILFGSVITPSSLIQESNATTPKDEITGISKDDKTTNSNTSFLFIQSAVSGTFTDNDGVKILTLFEISPSTVYFSDRPNRVTGVLDTNSFIALWGEGEDSFRDDPPNAALEISTADGNSDVFILELMNPVYNYELKTLQYDVKILSEASDGLTHYSDRIDLEIPATFNHSVLFIDDFFGWLKHNTVDKVAKVVLPILKPIVKDVVALAVKAVSEVASDIAGDKGNSASGDKGNSTGAAIGAEIGKQAVNAAIGVVIMSDPKDMDVNALIPILKKSSLPTDASNEKISLALTYNIFAKQETNIKESFLSFMHSFQNVTAITAVYDENSLCGTTNDVNFEKVLYPLFLHSLSNEFYENILSDLNSNMTKVEIQSDLDVNLKKKVKSVMFHSILHVKENCTGNDSGLYDLIYNDIISVSQVTEIPKNEVINDGKEENKVINDGKEEHEIAKAEITETGLFSEFKTLFQMIGFEMPENKMLAFAAETAEVVVPDLPEIDELLDEVLLAPELIEVVMTWEEILESLAVEDAIVELVENATPIQLDMFESLGGTEWLNSLTVEEIRLLSEQLAQFEVEQYQTALAELLSNMTPTAYDILDTQLGGFQIVENMTPAENRF